LRKKSRWILLLLITLLTMSMLISGCDKIAEKASEEATEKIIEQAAGGEADVEVDKDGNFELKTKDGSIKAGSTEWPDKIPSDVPQFKDGKITSVMESKTGENGIAYIIGIEDSSLEAVDKYKGELEANGWSVSFSGNTEESATFSAEKEKRSVTASFSIDENKKATGGISYAEGQ